MPTTAPTPIPAPEDLADNEIAVVIYGEPDAFGRVRLDAFWLDGYLPPCGVRAQVFHTNLAEFLASHGRRGVKVRGLDDATNKLIDTANES